jgi:sulfide:quinone oxidoreductase
VPVRPGRPGDILQWIPRAKGGAMITSPSARIVIAGGGVAALETALALRALVDVRLDVALVAPEEAFTYRPLSTLEPFREGAVRRFPLAALCGRAGARHLRGRIVAVDSWAQTATTDGGTQLPYDFLVLATGGRAEVAVPGALTFRDHRSVGPFRQLLDDLAADEARTVAFVVPDGATWPVPMYELALQTATWAPAHAPGVRVAVVSAESDPLAVLGERASALARELLGARGVALQLERTAVSFEDGRLWLGADGSFAVDRVVAAPLLRGRAPAGVPVTPDGFVPVGPAGRVKGEPRMFAAGDGADHAVRQGGLAAQQADAVAGAIAAELGADVEAHEEQPTLRTVLLTGREARFVRREPAGVIDDEEISYEAAWWPPAKIAARHLSPALAQLSEL